MATRCIRMAGGDTADLRIICANDSKVIDRWSLLAKAVPIHQASLVNRAMRKMRVPTLDFAESYCQNNKPATLLLPYQIAARKVPFRRVAWFPDFQHKYLPQFFSKQEIDKRDAILNTAARYADCLICSSKSVQDDYFRFHPRHAHKARVARFPSLLVFNRPSRMPQISAATYGLPKKFVLVVNQYWAHKNFGVVLEAMSILKQRGIEIPAVLVGLPVDWRSPTNEPVSELLRGIASRGLSGQVIPLGFVPRTHLDALMRLAAIIIQPSRFEGWSTCVQDAKALGRPIICSDLPVHREQAPDCLGFFGCDDSPALANVLEREWSLAKAGPNVPGEELGIRGQTELARDFGRILLEMCEG